MINTKPTNKILAIKTLRELPFAITTKTNSNGVEFQAIEVNASLRDLKELVESIMALQDSQYLVDNMKNEIEHQKAEIKRWQENYYNLRQRVQDSLDGYPVNHPEPEF